ncbi:unnamed protein product [Hyaloperonospora brassicae]|uniref:Nep1-like protein n=1 Tax=Hyaloperonospora brassicae TaxID=162125 RepID=A0AAV0TUI4_HYABA|nr:unnamed protein product [Hyaloperonospora brassicae]
MKTGVVLYGALLAAAVVFADEKKPNEKKSIALDQVRHIPQPEARSISEKAAVKFKPQILVSEGCHSFPAVNAEGETTVGMKINGTSDSTCKGAETASQIYGRSCWYQDKWAIMYVWNFPTYTGQDFRSDWEHVVVWLDNPALENPKLEAVSVWDQAYKTHEDAVPPEAKYMDGSSVKIELGKFMAFRKLGLTQLAGQSQDLIMWDQLSEKLKHALDSAPWGTRQIMPLSDSRFERALYFAWPFGPAKRAPPPDMVY